MGTFINFYFKKIYLFVYEREKESERAQKFLSSGSLSKSLQQHAKAESGARNAIQVSYTVGSISPTWTMASASQDLDW